MDEVLQEQQNYYRARAGEYDEWWERKGRYDHGEETNAVWFDEVAEVIRAFSAVHFDGDVLELAPGTGFWTNMLADRADFVTALDSSAEMLELNRLRLGPRVDNVELVEGDIFDWEPDQTWDAIVFCFWISHVPHAHLGPFLATCRRALRLGGTMFFVDGLPHPSSTAADHVLPDSDQETMIRRLNDGREFTIVKNFHDPDELVEIATAAEFDLDMHRTEHFFQYGVGIAT